MIRSLSAAVALAAIAASAQADDYSKWVKDETKKTLTCEYSYKPKAGTETKKQIVVIYYEDKDRAGWAYFYNAKQEPWARCAVPGNPKYDAKAMAWESLKADAKGYEPFMGKDNKPEPAGYCPTPKDGKSAIPNLPLPPK